MSRPVRPVAIEARAYRVPIETPVVASFGTMRDRPCVLVRAVDADGTEGFGEVWCNFPTVGAEHRARLVNDVVAPRLLGRAYASPAEAWADASRAMEVLALQSAEFGPLAQAIAGIDIALWDLSARKAGLPLHRALGGADCARVQAYASGLNPDRPAELARRRQQEGHAAFKLKIGFDRARDLRNLAELRAALGPRAKIMVDANQAHDLDSAMAFARAAAEFDVAWYEEPLRADAPLADWRRLAEASPIPLAAGENLRGEEFDAAIASGALRFLQPDIAKWGGFSGCLAVGRKAVAAGMVYCPHWLAGGVGLVASIHLLAAVGGEGLMEIDANPNPLREMLGGHLLEVEAGAVSVPSTPGLGFTPDLEALEEFRTWPARR